MINKYCDPLLPNLQEKEVKILHMTLKKVWFDMIASGEKKEEYREPKKYWINRLFEDGLLFNDAKHFDIVRFKNGYAKNCPEMDVELKTIVDLREGNPEWGAISGDCYIVLELGEVISIKNN